MTIGKKGKKLRILIFAILASLISMAMFFVVVKAGSLTPPGPVGATMRSLQEIYDAMAGTFDSSGQTASATGNIIQQLKYIAQMSLQQIYNNSSTATITTADNKDMTFSLANTATDSSFKINIGSGSSGSFQVQDNGTPFFTASSSGVDLAKTLALNQNQITNPVIHSGTFANRPATPVEGQLYFATDTRQLYTYANAKWQADRTTATKIVGTSWVTNPSQNYEKADYVADGTNDEVEIESAITALPAGGGLVYLLEGTYNIGTSIDIAKSNVTLTGSGNGTKLYLTNGANASVVVVGNGAAAYEGITISSLQVDGNKANQTVSTTNGVSFTRYVTKSKIENVSIHDNYNHGINIPSQDITEILITESKIYSNAQYGIFYDAGYNTGKNIFSNNFLFSNSIYGIAISRANGNVIEGNSVTSNGWGIDVNGGSNNFVTGNIVESNTYDGIVIDSSANLSDNNGVTGNTVRLNGRTGIKIDGGDYGIVKGNIVKDNSQSSNNGYDEIALGDNNSATYVVTEGNTVQSTQANKARYSISENSAVNADYNIISGNIVSGAVTGNIRSQGSHTTVAGNKISSDAEGIFDIQAQAGATQTALTVTQSGTGNIVNLTDNYITSGKGIYLANQESSFTGNGLEMDIASDQLEYSYFYNGTAYTDSTTEANSSGGTAYTLLGDITDDITYFGNSTTFDTLNFDISTAATSATLVWEYCSTLTTGACTGWTALTVADGTTGFTIDGKVTFTDPGALWLTGTVNSVSAKWLRVRAIALTGTPTANYSTISMFIGKFASLKNAGTEKLYINDQGDIYNQQTKKDVWTRMADAPVSPWGGASSVYTGGDYIYSVFGAYSDVMSRYSISSNVWTSMASAPSWFSAGASLIYTGGDFIYAIQGDNSTYFWRYSISGNSWSAMAVTPDTAYGGAAMAYTGGDYIYAFRGDNSTDFWRYSISGNSWISMTPTLGILNEGGALAYTGGDYLYGLRSSWSQDFYRYSISGNSWTSMANIPTMSRFSQSLIYTGGDYLYAFEAFTSAIFYRYSISSNTWTAMTSAPSTVAGGNSLVYAGGNYLYGLIGNGKPYFYRYSLGSDIGYDKLASAGLMLRGNINAESNVTFASKPTTGDALSLTATTTGAALTVIQSGTGAIINLKDGANNTALAIADGGAATFKPTAFDAVYNFDGAVAYTDNTTEAKTSLGTAFTALTLEASSNDEFYLGLDHPFNTVYFDIATAGAGVTLSAQYYSTAWSALTITDNTTNLTADGAVTFTALSDWTQTAINGTTKYWVRFRSPTTNITTAPTAYSVSPTTGNRFYVYGQSGDANPALYINDKGNIGVGIGNPATRLDIRIPDTAGGSLDEVLRIGKNSISNTGDGMYLTFDYDGITQSRIMSLLPISNSSDLRFYTTNSSVGNTRMTIGSSGNVGIGDALYTPGSRLTVNETAGGSIIDFQSSSNSLFTLVNEDSLKLDSTLTTSVGALNDNLIDDMEAITDWTASDGTNTPVASETTKAKVNDAGMKITTVASNSNADYVRKTYGSNQDWSGYGRIGFWIQASQTGQIASFQFYDSGAVTSDYNITISNVNEWQYEEWDISGITSTSRDAVSWTQFIIDSDTSSPIFYIDQLRLYNASSATNRMAELYLDAGGNLVLIGDEGVEIGRTVPGSNLSAMKIGAASLEIRNPLDLQVEGDVGIEYNLAFLNNNTSYITSAGPLIISAGDPNSFENLTITTSGTGDIIIDIADSINGFRIVGTGGGVFSVDKNGNIVVGGVNNLDADLTVKRNIATQGGNLTIAKLSTPANITVTPVGTAGSTTYGYRISAINGNGETLASATVTTATGNATLSATNYNSIAWDAVTGATSYKVYGRTSGAELYMATVNSPSLIYNDTGVAAPSGALPTANTTGGDIIGILSFSNATNLTIASDAITVSQTYHTVDEEGAAVDNLATVNGGSAGDILVLRGYDTDYLVTAKDGTGNLKLSGDFAFTDPNDTLTLMFNGTNWLEISRTTNGADIAESYYASDLSIEMGDIVSISSTNGIEKLEDKPNYFIEKTSKAYDPRLFGVISTNPFITMGGGYGKIADKDGNIKAETRSVALSGRVPAKVSLENGNIDIGDFLTSSSVHGVAMRATGSGRVVGRALEPFDGNATECNVEIVKMDSSDSPVNLELDSDGDLQKKEPQTLRAVNCKKIPSEVGTVMTFIELGWQGNGNDNGEWLEMNGWCVSIDDNGEWQKVKKSADTCEESAGSILPDPAPVSVPVPTLTPELSQTPTPESVQNDDFVSSPAGSTEETASSAAAP